MRSLCCIIPSPCHVHGKPSHPHPRTGDPPAHARDSPHPEGFVGAGLRSEGIWAAADVEMALFCYASGVVRGPFKNETRMRKHREDSFTGVV